MLEDRKTCALSSCSIRHLCTKDSLNFFCAKTQRGQAVNQKSRNLARKLTVGAVLHVECMQKKYAGWWHKDGNLAFLMLSLTPTVGLHYCTSAVAFGCQPENLSVLPLSEQ